MSLNNITFGRYKGRRLNIELIESDREYFEKVYLPFVKKKGWFTSIDTIVEKYLADTAVKTSEIVYPKIDYTRRPRSSTHPSI